MNQILTKKTFDRGNTKVLQIITLFSVGGATETVTSIAKGLMVLGYKVDIVTGPNIVSEGSMYEICQGMGVNVITFNLLRREINLIRDIKVILQLYHFIKKGGYQIVHTHSSKAGVLGRIAAKMARVPVVVHTLHGPPFHNYQKKFWKILFILIEKFSAKLCDKLIAVTHKIVQIYIENKIAPPNKLIMIRSGFNLEIFHENYNRKTQLRKDFNFSENDLIIGMIARFSLLKGHKFLLSAFCEVINEIPNAKLFLIGNGELENQFKKFVKEKKLLDKVIFGGIIEPQKIPEIINIMDILVHSSLVEGLARVIPQALIMARPVICFDLDGSSEVIQDGKNGYLIEPENIQMLASKIIYLCKNPEMIREFGQYGRKELKDEFSDEKMNSQIDIIYQELLKNKMHN